MAVTLLVTLLGNFTYKAIELTSTPVMASQKQEIAPTSEEKGACSCVLYVKSKGVKMPILGDASNLDIVLNSPPYKHGVVKLKYGNVYHLAYVESVEVDGIHISEANYKKCEVTYRVLDFDDKAIIGFARGN